MPKRWIIAGLLFLGGSVNYLDRSTISIVAPMIRKDFDLGPEKMGMVFSAFFVGYVLFSFVGGWAADRFGPRKVMGVAMIFWSLCCALTALATGFLSLLFLRFLFGMGEGPFNATLNKAINDWFPAKERARALGLAISGQPLGGAIAGPIVGGISLSYGWRAPFVAVAVIGIVWALAWFALYSAAHRGPQPGSAAAECASAPGADSRDDTPLSFYFKHPTVLAVAVAFFGYAYVAFFFLTWFPSYLVSEQGLSIKEMSFANVIPWMMGFLGLISGGFITDAIYRRVDRPVIAPKLVTICGLGVAALCVALAGLVTGLVPAVTLMALGIFALYTTGSAHWAILHDVIPAHRIGSVGGLVAMIATSSGIIGPALTGYIVKATGEFTSAFVLAGSISAVGAIMVAILVRPIQSPVADLAR